MYENIWKGNSDFFKSKMQEQWRAIVDDEDSEFEEKLEKMSDLLQEDGDLKYYDADYYTIFD
jgi:hypothetical protein